MMNRHIVGLQQIVINAHLVLAELFHKAAVDHLFQENLN